MSRTYDFKDLYVPKNNAEQLLARVVSLITDEEEAGKLLKDLFTVKEIAELLHQGKTYREVTKETDTSTTTVTCVAKSLFKGSGGLKSLLDKRMIGR